MWRKMRQKVRLIMKCKGCGKEFETNDKRSKYCGLCCHKKDDPITGGYIKRRGNTVEAKGILNCIMAFRGYR